MIHEPEVLAWAAKIAKFLQENPGPEFGSFKQTAEVRFIFDNSYDRIRVRVDGFGEKYVIETDVDFDEEDTEYDPPF